MSLKSQAFVYSFTVNELENNQNSTLGHLTQLMSMPSPHYTALSVYTVWFQFSYFA